MNQKYQIIRGIIILLVLMAAGVWALIKVARKTEEDSGTLIVKCLMTAGVLGILVFVVGPLVARGGYEAAFGGIPIAAGCAVVLAIIWGRNIGSLVADPLTGIFDGGDVAPEPKPLYSMTRSKLKLGKTDEALVALELQLEKFPNDLEGLMLLAEIQVEQRHDLAAAAVTVQRIANSPDRRPGEIAGAFYALADWHLRIAHDTEAARQALEEICTRLPDSEWSNQAAQRIAHLTRADETSAQRYASVIHVPQGVRNLGLMNAADQPLAAEKDPELETEEFVAHLALHPLDTDVREKLAQHYVRKLGRAEAGIEQLEFLVQFAHQPAKNIARWLNLIADFQVQSGHDPAAPRHTLQRIVELFPETSLAENAQRRLNILAYEFKAREKSQAVPLGSYEQNIGLKRSGPPTVT